MLCIHMKMRLGGGVVCEEGVGGGSQKHYNKVSKSLQTFGALYETRGSLNKSSVVKWVLD